MTLAALTCFNPLLPSLSPAAQLPMLAFGRLSSAFLFSRSRHHSLNAGRPQVSADGQWLVYYDRRADRRCMSKI
jgi:hypothetical protein